MVWTGVAPIDRGGRSSNMEDIFECQLDIPPEVAQAVAVQPMSGNAEYRFNFSRNPTSITHRRIVWPTVLRYIPVVEANVLGSTTHPSNDTSLQPETQVCQYG